MIKAIGKAWSWQRDISFDYYAEQVSFYLDNVHDEIYAVGIIDPSRLEYIPTRSVYYNSDCEY